MPFIFRILKAVQGLGAGAANPLYTVGAAPTTSAIISNVRFYNSGGVVGTASLVYKSDSGATASTFAKVIIPTSSTAIFNSELTLSTNNILQASTNVSLDVAVFGVERTQ